MEEGANSTAMVKDELVTRLKSIVLEESAVVKKEPNLDSSQTGSVADEVCSDLIGFFIILIIRNDLYKLAQWFWRVCACTHTYIHRAFICCG